MNEIGEVEQNNLELIPHEEEKSFKKRTRKELVNLVDDQDQEGVRVLLGEVIDYVAGNNNLTIPPEKKKAFIEQFYFFNNVNDFLDFIEQKDGITIPKLQRFAFSLFSLNGAAYSWMDVSQDGQTIKKPAVFIGKNLDIHKPRMLLEELYHASEDLLGILSKDKKKIPINLSGKLSFLATFLFSSASVISSYSEFPLNNEVAKINLGFAIIFFAIFITLQMQYYLSPEETLARQGIKHLME